MYIILWEYHVRLEKQAEFERVYAADGAWAQLFKNGEGYLGTWLWRAEDQSQSLCYLTVDRWVSQSAYETFLARWAEEYARLDALSSELTEQETRWGGWHAAVQPCESIV